MACDRQPGLGVGLLWEEWVPRVWALGGSSMMGHGWSGGVEPSLALHLEIQKHAYNVTVSTTQSSLSQ